MSPALAPFVEYVKRLVEPDRSLFLRDMRVYAGMEGHDLDRACNPKLERPSVRRQVWRQR